MFKTALFNVLPAFLAYAAAKDLTSMKIPNWVNLGVVFCFFIFAFLIGLDNVNWVSHLAAGVLTLVAAFTLFSFGWIGGGDAKLMAAMALWFGLTSEFFVYIALFSVIGGLLTFIIVMFRNIKLTLPPWQWLLQLYDKNKGVPYGIALAAAGIYLYPKTIIARTFMEKFM